MADYSKAVAGALRLIAAKGQPCTWQKHTETENAAAPWKPAKGAATDFEDVPIVFIPVGAGTAWLQYLGATEVPKGGVMGLLGAQEFSPSLKDTCLREDEDGNSEVLRVVWCDKMKPAEQTILNIVIFEK